jgi:hypothetical protein
MSDDASRDLMHRQRSADRAGWFERSKSFLAARSPCRPATKRRLTDQLGNVKIAIGAVRNHRLARLKMDLRAIEMDRDDIWFERYRIRAGRLVCCHAPRAAMCCSPARTLYQDVSPRSGC